MAFITDKFKGKYRLKTEIDHFSNQFPRDLNGTFSDYDIYIDCLNGVRVFYYGRGTMEVYVPSLGRGRNIIKAIYSDLVKPIEESKYMEVVEKEKDGEVITTNSFDYEGLYQDEELNKFIHTIIETDEEVMFRFKWDLMERFETYLKPKTSAANRSPFSSKNLPKCEYEIPEEDIAEYKEIVSSVSKENILRVGRITNDYIASLANKKKKLEDIKDEMKRNCLKAKEYIHYIGHWKTYLQFLKKEVEKL